MCQLETQSDQYTLMWCVPTMRSTLPEKPQSSLHLMNDAVPRPMVRTGFNPMQLLLSQVTVYILILSKWNEASIILG